ncbi:Hypothetical protein FKW44_022425 [Caligus rogercresseyi]|uniref:Uncharacterized protein n=1 Tax=Caligus rogercresseyi TaxID=217165 RepID=A0A7T8GMY5_CALRO|nr:Hypothetical protein FKW44_022425 [Caligus rogercresseyi]
MSSSPAATTGARHTPAPGVHPSQQTRAGHHRDKCEFGKASIDFLVTPYRYC